MDAKFLNTSVTWHKITGEYDKHGQPLTISTPIKVRKEDKRRQVRDAKGQTVISEAEIICLVGVKAGDLIEIDGVKYPVISVLEPLDLDGNVTHREVAI